MNPEDISINRQAIEDDRGRYAVLTRSAKGAYYTASPVRYQVTAWYIPDGCAAVAAQYAEDYNYTGRLVVLFEQRGFAPDQRVVCVFEVERVERPEYRVTPV